MPWTREKTEPKVSKIKGIINNRAEISDKEKKNPPSFKRLRKLTWFFKKINSKILLGKSRKNGYPNQQNYKWKGDIRVDTIKMQRNLRGYCE